ncbi:MAG: sulfotransferase [Candidatus Brocadiia bacterium]|nr:sulfotransferase [Candidatus Brocadiia bacterium]
MDVEIRAPIFIVGAPRSGTSVFYEKLARHPDLAWISNITKKAPSSPLLTRMIMLFRTDHRPTEAKKVWGRFSRGDDDSLGRQDTSPRARRFLRKVVGNNLALFNKPRFVCKAPGNSARMGFLDEVLPDAIFLHVIRDGRAVANSLLRIRRRHEAAYWGMRPPGWRALVELPMLEACAMQWKLTVEQALGSAAEIPAERYMETRYEAFVERPVDVLNAVAEKCELAWDQGALKELAGDLEDRNVRWREDLTPADIETLNSLLGDLLARLGYER